MVEKLNIIIVSPYSPRWSNTASIRWEKFSKYLSFNHDVTLVVSSFKNHIKERSFDIGKANIIEIPLKYYVRNPFSESRKKTCFIAHRIKAEARVILEKIFPVSSGGMLYHDLKAYKNVIRKRLAKSRKNILITTYDPWFSLKIGNWFKRNREDLIWVADFRDPSFNVHESIFSKLSIFRVMTASILKQADLVTVVSRQMEKNYRDITNKKVLFLPNGYDGKLDHLYSSKVLGSKGKNSLSITYTGSLYPKTREISFFVEALKQAKTRFPNIRFVFKYAGLHSEHVKSEFLKRNIDDILEDFGLIERDEALKLQKKADILLLIVYTGDNESEGKGIRTGKVYEYIASGKPILVIAPQDWEMKEDIESDGVSRVFHKSQISEMAEYLIKLSMMPKIEIDQEARRRVMEKYLYKNLTKKLEEAIIETLQGYK